MMIFYRTGSTLAKPIFGPKDRVHLSVSGDITVYEVTYTLNEEGAAEEIEAETGWSKSTVMINLYKVAKKSGVGILRSNDMLHLMMPPGASRDYPRAKVVASNSTVRSMADEVVIIEHKA